MANANLTNAKKAKNDEFYTQLTDIEKEMRHYKDFFKGKVVYCNCDDARESNFFKYFSLNFEHLGLKKLISTGYKENGKGVVLIYEGDKNGNRQVDENEIQVTELKGNGDFRSEECIEFLKQADVVVTNPPFSLFREFVSQLMEFNKDFIIIGNGNAVTYKETFPLIKGNLMWLGNSIHSGDREFQVPDEYPLTAAGWRIDENGKKYIRVKGVRWFTNIDHGRRHQPLQLMSMVDNLRFHKKLKGQSKYYHYDNYNAIDVPFTELVPSDYDGIMGVPVSFVDKYCPEQFEILGMTDRDSALQIKKYTKEQSPKYSDLNRRGAILINGELISTYPRILIRHKKQ